MGVSCGGITGREGVEMNAIRFLVYAGAAFCFISSSAFAASPTPHEAALTKLAAKALYAESRCPKTRANTGALATVASVYGVSIEDWQRGGRLRALLEADISVMKAELDGGNNRVFCKAAETTMGPNGKPYPGLLVSE